MISEKDAKAEYDKVVKDIPALQQALTSSQAQTERITMQLQGAVSMAQILEKVLEIEDKISKVKQPQK